MAFIKALPVVMKYFAVLPGMRVKSVRLRESTMFIVCSLPMLIILVPNIVYLASNYDSLDVVGVTDSIFVIFMVECNWTGYFIIAMRQIRFRDLFAELKVVVANSRY